jgi:hypothetical protein
MQKIDGPFWGQEKNFIGAGLTRAQRSEHGGATRSGAAAERAWRQPPERKIVLLSLRTHVSAKAVAKNARRYSAVAAVPLEYPLIVVKVVLSFARRSARIAGKDHLVIKTFGDVTPGRNGKPGRLRARRHLPPCWMPGGGEGF